MIAISRRSGVSLVIRGQGNEVKLQRSAKIAVGVGRQGPAGPPGSGSHYEHVQEISAEVWTIAHNLGHRPVVSVTTDGGLERMVEVRHLSANTLQLNFQQASIGQANLV